jgi:prepilin-type processing-associated H-X9-DG protein
MHGSQPGSSRKRSGLTRVEVTVIIATLGALLLLLVTVGLPVAKARVKRIVCYNQLRSLGVANRLFATDSEGRFPASISTNEGGSLECGPSASAYWFTLRNEIGTTRIFICPADHRSEAASWRVLSDTNLSYFASLDAAFEPGHMVLSGDRNLVLNGTEATPGFLTLTNDQTLSWSRALHRAGGNLLFVDGRAEWTQALRLTSNHLSTNLINRLAVP